MEAFVSFLNLSKLKFICVQRFNFPRSFLLKLLKMFKLRPQQKPWGSARRKVTKKLLRATNFWSWKYQNFFFFGRRKTDPKISLILSSKTCKKQPNENIWCMYRRKTKEHSPFFATKHQMPKTSKQREEQQTNSRLQFFAVKFQFLQFYWWWFFLYMKFLTFLLQNLLNIWW